jgi:hypothetical protein
MTMTTTGPLSQEERDWRALRLPGRPPARGFAQEDPACPATLHAHSAGGYRGGCRCPSTLKAWQVRQAQLDAARERYEDKRRAKRRAEQQERERNRETLDLREPGREVDECPASKHRHDRFGYKQGCRCPSTIKSYENWLVINRAASERYRQRRKAERERDKNIAPVDLRKADRFDAEAIAQGYRLPRISMHTRALAVKIMRQANPLLTDRQVAWKLTAAGQGRTVHRGDGTTDFEPVSMRQVQRIQAALDWKELRHPHRAGSRLDRSGRTR